MRLASQYLISITECSAGGIFNLQRGQLAVADPVQPGHTSCHSAHWMELLLRFCGHESGLCWGSTPVVSGDQRKILGTDGRGKTFTPVPPLNVLTMQLFGDHGDCGANHGLTPEQYEARGID